MSNRAWVTLATNDSYGLGALVVAHSLRRSGSVYPAVVLITPSVTEAMSERLRAVFAEVVVVDVLDSRDAAHLALLRRPELGITFTKIHCWNLTQYEKCVFLDADTLIVQNCDELFEREELSAAPDVGWPDCFNSGVFVFKPSAETFSNLITFASERGSFDGGDQGLLNSYFSDWAQGDINKHLPFLYNVTSAAFYSYIPALKHYGQNLKIIHFIGATKPWLQHYNWQSRSVEAPEHLRDFVQLWWDLFVGQVHTQLDTAMGEVVEDPLAILREETVNYNEPTETFSYYEPALDEHSEFPWHHPDKQVLDQNISVPEIDMTQFYDPWDIYRGNIPAIKHDSKQTEQTRNDHYEESVRNYAWDYIHPPHHQYHTKSLNYEQMPHDNQHNAQYHNDNYSSEYKEDVCQSNLESSHNNNQMNINLDVPHWNSQHNSDTQYHSHDHDYGVAQHHYDSTSTTHHSHDAQHIQEHTYTEPNHEYEHHYNNVNTPQVSTTIFNEPQSHNNESQVHVDHTHLLQHHEHHLSKKTESFSSFSQFKKQNRPELAYTVMMDHHRLNHHTPEEKVNGYASDDDSDIYEEITPRHPYDDFYLRHRMTIDSRGRKICSHEIPIRPPSPASESSDEFEDALESLPDQIMNKELNGEHSQTGVAGNLARVVPGAPQQQEAVDELTRRQGWEAGNIDYMGADSFDNIWAKISQTLSQPPNSAPEQPEPPKEEAQSEAVPDPPSAPAAAEIAKEVIEPSSQEVSVVSASEAELVAPSESEPVKKAAEDPVENVVEVTEEKKVEVAPSESSVPPVEVPQPVETEAPVTPAALSAEAAPVAESTATEVPVPADEAPASEAVEAPGKPEEIIPVPVEAAAAVELAESAESTADVQGKTEEEVAEIPVAAVEALKIDEAPAAAEVLPAPVSVPEPTPAPKAPEEPKPTEIADKSEAVSDSPPLANTPSKEEIPGAPAAKSEERRKPAGKLQLRPPLAADPALTPDSEAEDAAALAQSIIAGELRTPTVTAPTPPALSPALPPAASRLSVQEPAVSLSQIGVKAKPSTAAQIESSVSVKTDSAPSTPESPKTVDPPKKKIVKKVLKKDKEGASSGEAPVPPPRKKEKKPKEK